MKTDRQYAHIKGQHELNTQQVLDLIKEVLTAPETHINVHKTDDGFDVSAVISQQEIPGSSRESDLADYIKQGFATEDREVEVELIEIKKQ